MHTVELRAVQKSGQNSPYDSVNVYLSLYQIPTNLLGQCRLLCPIVPYTHPRRALGVPILVAIGHLI